MTGKRETATPRVRVVRWITDTAWLPYALAAVFSFTLVWFAWDLGSLDWRVPLYYNGDALAVASHFKTVIETGWFTDQPALGAPFGQHYNDYPTADNLHFMVAYLLSLVSHDFGVIMNVYFIAGFPLAALTAVWFLRVVGVSRLLAVALAVVFALAPYHFIKGEGHLFLASYYVVPLALVVVYRVALDQPIWRMRDSGPRWTRAFTARSTTTIAILVLLGTASSYYSIFTALILAVVGVAVLWRTRSWRRFFGAAAAGLLIAVTMLVNLIPDFVYRLANGTNDAVFIRSPPEADLYSFKFAALLLPMPDHRFEPFRVLRQLYDTHYPLPSEAPALGLIAGAGFVGLFVIALYFLLAAGRLGWSGPREYVRRLSTIAGITFVAFFFGTVGGLSTFLSFVSFPIRSWNRIAIVIALLALAALGLILDRVVGCVVHCTTRSRAIVRGYVAGVLAVFLMVVAVWDQVPPVSQAARSQTTERFTSDKAFVRGIENAVAPGCLVYQLPYIPFPESPPINGVTDSDQLRMFLHSTTLRWSAGGIKGRGLIDSVGGFASLPVAQMREALVGIDACGVVVDRAAIGAKSTELIRDLTQVFGSPALFSPDGRFAFVKLNR